MTETIEIRRWFFVVAGFAAVFYVGGGLAQVTQSTPRSGAKTQTPAVTLDNSSADAMAYSKLNAGQIEDASAAFQAILALQPKDAGALAGMGQVRMLQRNYLGAVSFLEQAKQASPNDATIAGALDGARFQFLMGEGKDAMAAKDAVDAEKRYRDALELRPNARQAVDALVNVLVAENKLREAQDALSTAVAQGASASERPPVELELELAQLDIASSQPQLAYPIFLQVLQDSPGRTDAWSGLISALHLMGHDADAVAQEKVVPAGTRAQLEATPGFQQMMAVMTAAPTQSATADAQSYTPFVLSAPSSNEQPASLTSPAVPGLTITPDVPGPAHSILSSRHSPVTADNVHPRSAIARPVNAAPVPKLAVGAPSQVGKIQVDAAQTGTPSHPSISTPSGAPLVTQPATKAAVHSGEDIPDTGEQQYPQPKVRPRLAARPDASAASVAVQK